jgi:hypothetical protein
MEIKQDKISFTVFFAFEANTYFQNTELWKSFIYNESQDLIKIESSTINWNSNEVNPTKMLKKTQKKSNFFLILEGKKDKETTSQWEDVESFFSIFKNENNLEDPDAEADVQNEEEEADVIKDDLLPNALSYYLNIMPAIEDCDSCEDEDIEDHDGNHNHKHGKKGGEKEGKEKCKNQ